MKKLSISLMVGIAVMALSSCGGSGSSDGMFGAIPETIEKYSQEKGEKAQSMKEETIAKLEKEGEALNGKELAVTVDENELKVETPLTLVYKGAFSNVKAVEFALDGKIVAANDMKLEINPSDLKGRELLGGKTSVVTAYLPVHIEFLDSEGNVLDTRTIGNLYADNNGEEAVIKAGTPVDFAVCSIPVSDKYLNAASARVVIDLTKGLTSERMPE